MKKMKHVFILTGLLFSVITNILAQEFKGRVTDNTGNPVPFANVILMCFHDSAFITCTVTDDAGGYQMKCNEPRDNLIVKARYIGYQPFFSLSKTLVLLNFVMHDASTD